MRSSENVLGNQTAKIIRCFRRAIQTHNVLGLPKTTATPDAKTFRAQRKRSKACLARVSTKREKTVRGAGVCHFVKCQPNPACGAGPVFDTNSTQTIAL